MHAGPDGHTKGDCVATSISATLIPAFAPVSVMQGGVTAVQPRLVGFGRVAVLVLLAMMQVGAWMKPFPLTWIAPPEAVC